MKSYSNSDSKLRNRVLVSLIFSFILAIGFTSESVAQDEEKIPITEEKTPIPEEKTPAMTNDHQASIVTEERLFWGFLSIFFTAVPLGLGTIVFLFLLKREQDHAKFVPYFGNGQLVQLLVIVLVAGNVCSLAILGVLGKSEVAAIYGGIVGYVLGRRVSRRDEESEIKESQITAGGNPP